MATCTLYSTLPWVILATNWDWSGSAPGPDYYAPPPTHEHFLFRCGSQEAWAFCIGIVSGQLQEHIHQADTLIDVHCHCYKGRKVMEGWGQRPGSASTQKSRSAYWNGYRSAGYALGIHSITCHGEWLYQLLYNKSFKILSGLNQWLFIFDHKSGHWLDIS